MVTKCANPDCGAPFLYLRHGRLFAIPRPGASLRAANIEYFWLCGNCAGRLTIDSRRGAGMHLAPWNGNHAPAEQPI
jgi:hypothetical protein